MRVASHGPERPRLKHVLVDVEGLSINVRLSTRLTLLALITCSNFLEQE